MKLKKFLCLFLGLLVVSALIVPVSAGSWMRIFPLAVKRTIDL